MKNSFDFFENDKYNKLLNEQRTSVNPVFATRFFFYGKSIGIRNGAVGMVHLYPQDVKDRCVEMGLTTHEKISKNSKVF